MELENLGEQGPEDELRKRLDRALGRRLPDTFPVSEKFCIGLRNYFQDTYTGVEQIMNISDLVAAEIAFVTEKLEEADIRLKAPLTASYPGKIQIEHLNYLWNKFRMVPMILPSNSELALTPKLLERFYPEPASEPTAEQLYHFHGVISPLVINGRYVNAYQFKYHYKQPELWEYLKSQWEDHRDFKTYGEYLGNALCFELENESSQDRTFFKGLNHSLGGKLIFCNPNFYYTANTNQQRPDLDTLRDNMEKLFQASNIRTFLSYRPASFVADLTHLRNIPTDRTDTYEPVQLRNFSFANEDLPLGRVLKTGNIINTRFPKYKFRELGMRLCLLVEDPLPPTSPPSIEVEELIIISKILSANKSTANVEGFLHFNMQEGREILAQMQDTSRQRLLEYCEKKKISKSTDLINNLYRDFSQFRFLWDNRAEILYGRVNQFPKNILFEQEIFHIRTMIKNGITGRRPPIVTDLLDFFTDAIDLNQ